MSKVAVVLFNLGGPDSKSAIEPFLFNFFMDKNIVRLPLPFRWLLAKFISKRRSRKQAGESYGELGNKSPLLENSQAQAEALENTLGENFKVFVCMRYWHPMADEVARKVKEWGAEKIILLPLYPQFSTTTTWSSLGAWKKAAAKIALKAPTNLICCYPLNEGFIAASASNIREAYRQALKDGHRAPRVLFSAHGLPESVIKDGDPYQYQCEQTARRIAEVLGLPESDWRICYQSRVGAQKWIGPATEDEIRRAGAEGQSVIIYPHAFTQEHVETLVELDIEYREVGLLSGVKGYYRADTVSTHPDFISGLAKLVQSHIDRQGAQGENGICQCADQYSRCCMRSANV